MSSRPVVILLMRAESPGTYSIERLFESLLAYLRERFEVKIVRVPCQSRGLLRCIYNLIFTARLNADVIHVTGDIYYCALAIHRWKCVLTIHDLCSLNRLRGWRRRVFSLFWYSLPLRWATAVTAISQETRRQLEERFPCVKGAVEVVPNCVDGRFHRASAQIAKSEPPQVLQVGTGPNKNLERVAIAASTLPVNLRIIGALTIGQQDFLASLGMNWTSAHDLSDEELIREYRRSGVLAFVSTYEGFGLPIVEAQAIGLPVVTSNTEPMAETAGDGAILVDPYNIPQIRKAIEDILFNPELAEGMAQRGARNAGRFSAAVLADRYCNVYACMVRA